MDVAVSVVWQWGWKGNKGQVGEKRRQWSGCDQGAMERTKDRGDEEWAEMQKRAAELHKHTQLTNSVPDKSLGTSNQTHIEISINNLTQQTLLRKNSKTLIIVAMVM